VIYGWTFASPNGAVILGGPTPKNLRGSRVAQRISAIRRLSRATPSLDFGTYNRHNKTF
jgi:hypothetical protein